MKKLFSFLSLVVAVMAFQSKANACAQCVDIQTEKIWLSASASAEVVKVLNLKKGQIIEEHIEEVNCVKKAEWLMTEDGPVISCSIPTWILGKRFVVSLTEKNAAELLKRIYNFRAEIKTSGESGDESIPPTGKKQALGEKFVSGEKIEAKLNVTAGQLRCAVNNRGPSCVLIINGVNMTDIPLSL